ncbi:MAG TPA: peptide chain release factor N(5)-glutamine methyltransferase [Blastocatellia bacterium]|nr:peptide chain release factor N(5)-glutamine methyltransferase [Blastocatellia bacterium]
MPTIAQAITEGTARLHAAGIDQDRRTAGLLLCHVMGIDRTHLLTRSKEQIDEAQYREYLALIERRAAGEPLQYLTGHQEFYGLDFIVTPDVLIPRPETEFLIERIMKLVAEPKKDSPLIVDVGTGSGCIAVTLAKELPSARLIATDASSAALKVARKNAERHGVHDRIEFLEGDLLAPLAERRLEGAVDILASNPPYVNEDGRQLLQREVRDWEPHEALFGGTDGLNFYRRLLAESPQILKSEGHVVLEIGFSQVESISEMVKGSALRLLDITRDLNGIPRTLCLRA